MVFTVSMPFVSSAPPTTAAFAAPLPFSPWHAAHFCAYTGAPCAGVPLPGGKPVPSGRMLMSQAAISAVSMDLPRSGPAARQPKLTAKINTAPVNLCVDMAYRPRAADRPAGHAVVVLAREGRHRRDFRSLAAYGDDLRAGRLHVARLVPCPALQYGGAAIPVPRNAEPGEGLAQHRLVQGRLRPALATVRRDRHFRNAAIARISDAGYLVEARRLQHQPRRRVGDEGLHLLQEIKLVRLSVRQDGRVRPRLVVAHRGRLDELQAAQPFDVHVAFPAGKQQAHRIAVAGHQPLAVLVES